MVFGYKTENYISLTDYIKNLKPTPTTLGSEHFDRIWASTFRNVRNNGVERGLVQPMISPWVEHVAVVPMTHFKELPLPPNMANIDHSYPTISAPKLAFLVSRFSDLITRATNPENNDLDKATVTAKLVTIINDPVEFSQFTGSPRRNRLLGCQTAGFVICNRLNTKDENIALMCLDLLDTLMRACPYFYGGIAHETFLTRIWTFVNPKYGSHTSPLSKAMLKKSHYVDSKASYKVRLLLHAWREELVILPRGLYGTAVSFFVNHYHKFEPHIPFPEIPEGKRPWVYPVGWLLSSFKKPGSAAGAEAAYELRDVENMAVLFSDLVERAKGERELLQQPFFTATMMRCKYIARDLDNFDESWNFTKSRKVRERAKEALRSMRSALNGYEHLIKDDKVETPTT